MSNPYAKQPDYAFWKRSMSGRSATEVDPVTHVPFRITRGDKVATAGSCFAQHISRTLVELGFTYLVTEKVPENSSIADESYGLFPARFANIYTARQMLQLFQRAYGLLDPIDVAWRRRDGRYVDPFRPRVQESGYLTIEDLMLDRESHLAAVRDMFESCDVFVFTLGLTEGWISSRDGAVFPLAPGVVSESEDSNLYRFHNFSVSEIEADLSSFIDQFRIVNPEVRIVLTVSPVSLLATYEDRHVLVSTTYSKSVLRVAAETTSRQKVAVAYFPSYEIITGPQTSGRFYEDDLREVRPEAVRYVMDIFSRHYLSEEIISPNSGALAPSTRRLNQENEIAAIREVARVICDEEALDATP